MRLPPINDPRPPREIRTLYEAAKTFVRIKDDARAWCEQTRDVNRFANPKLAADLDYLWDQFRDKTPTDGSAEAIAQVCAELLGEVSR